MTKDFIIDSQVHAYEANNPSRPWQGFLQGPAQATGDDMVKAMGEVGVDGALLVSPFSLYGYDASYALEVHRAHPDKFGLIKPFDVKSETIREDLLEWASIPSVVGARLMLSNSGIQGIETGIREMFSAASDVDIPVNVYCSGNLSAFKELAKTYPNTQLVIDHLGLEQPFIPPPPEDPFSDIGQVIEFSKFDNVAIKISGACTLSQRPFPYDDIWEPLERIFKAFGFERCMWGTDWTRAVELLTYEQGVESFQLTDSISDNERNMLMGGTLSKIYNWQPRVRH
ncbi:MAG: amidohydrolase family protein [Chloroflexota bacterium]